LTAPAVAQPGTEPLQLAASHAPPLSSVSELGNSVLSSDVGEKTMATTNPSAAAAAAGAAGVPSRTYLYMPPPYDGVCGAETWGMHERARKRDKDEAAFEDSQDLFAQLLAEAKADQGYSQRAASQQTSKQLMQQQANPQALSKEPSWERGDYY